MFKIRNYQDLSLAYEILQIANERIKADKVAELKREIRSFVNRPTADRRIVRDDGMDGYVVLFPLPNYLQTVAEATAYFEDHEYIQYSPSAYDCTGQAFTSWYKIFLRNGCFWAYHSISFDV